MNLTITVLIENTAAGQGLLAEHGLACWIEGDGRRVLFDTGQGLILAGNAYRMQVPLYEADAIVLSHGHYDHTGGLSEVLGRSARASVYAHPACLDAKFIRMQNGSMREVGIPDGSRRAMESREHAWIKTDEAQQVLLGLTVTGTIPRVTDFDDTGGASFLDREGRRADPLEDDQALFFDTPQGIVVLLGCAHAGVINTLLHIRQLTGNRPIHSVLGGMHLVDASNDRLQRTMDELRQLDVQRLGPAHCTGSRAVAALWHAFPERCLDYRVGTRLEFEVR